MISRLVAYSRHLFSPLHWQPAAREADQFERVAPDAAGLPPGAHAPAPAGCARSPLLISLERCLHASDAPLGVAARMGIAARMGFAAQARALSHARAQDFLAQLEGLPLAQAQRLAGLHVGWGDLFDRFTLAQTLRFSRWLRRSSAADHRQWMQDFATTVRREARRARLCHVERAEVDRIHCLTLLHRHCLEPNALPAYNLGVGGLRTADAHQPPTAWYDSLCAALQVAPQDRMRFRPWIAAMDGQPRSGALQWEVLELVMCYLSPQADPDAARLLRQLPPCVHACVASALPAAAAPEGLTLPRGLPQLLLRGLSLSFDPPTVAAPQAQRALLRMLLPHCQDGADDLLLRCARAAHRLGDAPWPWLACKQEQHDGVDEDAERDAWLQCMVDAPPPPRPLPAGLALWIVRGLHAARGPAFAKLVAWVVDTDLLAAGMYEDLFRRDDGEPHAQDARTQQHLATLFCRAPRATQQWAAQHGHFRRLLPPLAQTLCAQDWLSHGACQERGEAPAPLQALRHGLEGTLPPAPLRATFPEFALLETPAQVLSAGLPATLAAPAWAREALASEAPCAHEDAAHAQRNRVRALGRFLLACRVSLVPAERVAALAPAVRQLLALPDAPGRQRLLDRLVARVLTVPHNDDAYATALRLQAELPAKALPLALAAFFRDDATHTDAAAQTLLRARKLFNHGEHARSLLNLLLAPQDMFGVADAALCWADAAKLARVIDAPAQGRRDRSALREAKRAWRAAQGLQQGPWAALSAPEAAMSQPASAHGAAASQMPRGPDAASGAEAEPGGALCQAVSTLAHEEKAEAEATLRDAQERLRQTLEIGALHTAARAQLRAALAAPALSEEQRHAVTRPLRKALAWLQTLPALREALSHLSQAAQVSHLSPPDSAPLSSHEGPDALAPCWARARAALKAAKARAPRGEAWLHRYAESVVQALQSHAPSPGPAAARCGQANDAHQPRVPAPPNPALSRHGHAHRVARDLPPAPLDAAFFAHPSLRAFVVERILPLALELTRYAPLLRASGVPLGSLTDAAEVLPACAPWTQLDAADLRRLEAACPDLRYLALYAGDMQRRWLAPHRDAGLEILRALARAGVAEQIDATRRDGPQARRILALPGGEALMARWERPEPPQAMAPEAAGLWTAEDTGAPDTMLRAVTDVRSCQSADGGSENRGMLGRLADGARRIALLRDKHGAVRARAVMRLMLAHESPVLLLGPPYVASGVDFQAAAQALCAHAARRGAALGVPAVVDCEEYRDPHAEGVKSRPLTCAGGLPDYWDGGGGTRDDAVVLEGGMALLANR